jgi:hypothetical protein
MTRPLTAFALLAALVTAAAPARADDEEELEPEQHISGRLEEESEGGDDARTFGNVLLWVPRNVIDLLFRGTTAAANLVADEQLVPRYQELLGAPPGGTVLVYPTLFAETDSPFSIGARMLVDTRHITTSQRFGFGGPHDVVVESRVIVKGGATMPVVLSLELLYQLENDIEYHGIGVEPKLDPRNHFTEGTPHEAGLYTEAHVRGIGSLGVRFGPRLEQFLSVSLARRQVEDSNDVGDEALSRVFEPGSIPGVNKNTWLAYAEMAMRYDSRRFRARPTPGALVEAYAGGARSTAGEDVAFMRVGGRIAGFIPIYRRTNILSPRIVYDRLIPLNGLPIPFNEVPRQPDFRGFDTRRDNFSVVASLDYTWLTVPFLGLRLFLDGATVAPSLGDFELENLEEMRFAGGFGVDLYTNRAQLGRLQIAISPDGPRLHLSIGTPEGFGDRQHRE